MKYPHPIKIKFVLGAVLTAGLVALQSTEAADFIKSNALFPPALTFNYALNVDGSYTTPGVPGTGDTIVFDAIYTRTSTLPVGTGGISVRGINVLSTNTSADINISGGAADFLTLGSGWDY